MTTAILDFWGDDRGARAYVARAPELPGVRVWFVRGVGTLREFFDTDTSQWREHESGTDVPPAISLGDDAARALHQGLSEHYHGEIGDRALRKDYEAERARVDKFIAFTTERRT